MNPDELEMLLGGTGMTIFLLMIVVKMIRIVREP